MAKGDVIARQTNGQPLWVPVGSDGEVLTADSAADAGVSWGAGGGGGGYDTVEEEGTPLTQRTTIDFQGAGVTAADSGGVTVVTIPGGGGGGGAEIGYVQRTSNVTISATSEASPTSLGLTLGSLSYDGNPVLLEFFCADFSIPTGVLVLLFESTTMMCRWGDMRPASGSAETSCFLSMRFQPSAGSHEYLVQAIRAGGSNATLNAGSGTGGAGTYAPAYLRASYA